MPPPHHPLVMNSCFPFCLISPPFHIRSFLQCPRNNNFFFQRNQNKSKVLIRSCVKTQHFSKFILINFFLYFYYFFLIQKNSVPVGRQTLHLPDCETTQVCTVLSQNKLFCAVFVLYCTLPVPVPECTCTLRYLILYCTIPVSVLYYTWARRNCFCTVLQYTERYCSVVYKT